MKLNIDLNPKIYRASRLYNKGFFILKKSTKPTHNILKKSRMANMNSRTGTVRRKMVDLKNPGSGLWTSRKENLERVRRFKITASNRQFKQHGKMKKTSILKNSESRIKNAFRSSNATVKNRKSFKSNYSASRPIPRVSFERRKNRSVSKERFANKKVRTFLAYVNRKLHRSFERNRIPGKQIQRRKRHSEPLVSRRKISILKPKPRISIKRHGKKFTKRVLAKIRRRSQEIDINRGKKRPNQKFKKLNRSVQKSEVRRTSFNKKSSNISKILNTKLITKLPFGRNTIVLNYSKTRKLKIPRIKRAKKRVSLGREKTLKQKRLLPKFKRCKDEVRKSENMKQAINILVDKIIPKVFLQHQITGIMGKPPDPSLSQKSKSLQPRTSKFAQNNIMETVQKPKASPCLITETEETQMKPKFSPKSSSPNSKQLYNSFISSESLPLSISEKGSSKDNEKLGHFNVRMRPRKSRSITEDILNLRRLTYNPKNAVRRSILRTRTVVSNHSEAKSESIFVSTESLKNEAGSISLADSKSEGSVYSHNSSAISMVGSVRSANVRISKFKKQSEKPKIRSVTNLSSSKAKKMKPVERSSFGKLQNEENFDFTQDSMKLKAVFNIPQNFSNVINFSKNLEENQPQGCLKGSIRKLITINEESVSSDAEISLI